MNNSFLNLKISLPQKYVGNWNSLQLKRKAVYHKFIAIIIIVVEHYTRRTYKGNSINVNKCMRELKEFFPFLAVFAAGSTYHSIQAACYHAPYVCMLGAPYQHVHKATQNDPLSVTVISSLPSTLPCPQNFLYQMEKWPLNQNKSAFYM
jgi:hypothetical protein